jgi:type III restriction enzyme
MELKNYQRQVIADLSRYLDFLNRTQNSSIAYKQFWNDKGINVGFGGVPAYQDIMPGVPNICFKVPTGGGKTFLACNAIRPIFDALPVTKTHVVVWLVPSDAILTQTVKCLKDTYHPYRQKIDVDFGSRVEVYTKQELLNGQNFNPTTVTEQLSIMVLSYDSFRGRGKDVLKAYQ